MERIIRFFRNLDPAILGILCGVLYGVVGRLVLGFGDQLNSMAFLFVLPLVLGMIPWLLVGKKEYEPFEKRILMPLMIIFTFFVTLLLLGTEDAICLIILSLPFLIMGLVGAWLIKLLYRSWKGRNRTQVVLILLLPFLMAPVEQMIESPSEEYSVRSEVRVRASAPIVWNHIVVVEPIQPAEYSAGFFNRVGIPRPISARVSAWQVGGKRWGRFEEGLQFVETITDYQPGRRVAFDIEVNPNTIRPRVIDQHVLKGHYFGFVNAAYTLEPQPDGTMLLALTSRYRLTSKVNFYGRFWGDLVLKDFQDRLLEVIQHRCEAKGIGTNS